MKVKVCGMKFKENIAQIAALQPDYLGFIFYKNSKRFYTEERIDLLENIQKVGVFVKAEIDEIINFSNQYKLDVIQLHGGENADFLAKLKTKISHGKIWKVFSIDHNFDFNELKNFHLADAFLFDTKGKNHGGNGAKFNWKMLEKYTHQKPFILSGGIDENDVNEIKNLAQKIPWLQTVDINSCFEEKPGYKNPEKIQKFINDFKNLA